MSDEIKTEDIIKSLRACARFDACKKCIFVNEDARCTHSLMEESADMMELLCEKLNAARLENELLRGADQSRPAHRPFCGHQQKGAGRHRQS